MATPTQEFTLDDIEIVDDAGNALEVLPSGPRARIAARRLNPAPNSMNALVPEGDRSTYGAATSAPVRKSLARAVTLASPVAGLVTDPREAMSTIGDATVGAGRAVAGFAQQFNPFAAPSPTLAQATSPTVARLLQQDPIIGTAARGADMAHGLYESGKRLLAPSREITRNQQIAPETNQQATEAAGEQLALTAGPIVAGGVARLPAVRAARTQLGVEVPSNMMNNMLVEGNPKIRDAALKNIDRTTYKPVDPRQPGARDPGLQNLDDIGPVRGSRTGARETRAQLDRTHADTQAELNANPSYQQPLPRDMIIEALSEPVLKRIDDIQSGRATGNAEALRRQLDEHVADFENYAQGDYRPAVLNEFKSQRYESLKRYRADTSTDPGLQAVLQEQALNLRDLVNRSTADPNTGISQIAELNDRYGMQREALDAWEGLIVNKKAGGNQPSSIISPQGQSIGTVTTAPIRRSLVQKFGDALLRSPASVTTRADLLRMLAPDAPTTPLAGRRLQPIPQPTPTPVTPGQPQLPSGPPVPPQRLIGGPNTPPAIPPAFDELAGSAGVRMRPGATTEQGTPGPVPQRRAADVVGRFRTTSGPVQGPRLAIPEQAATGIDAAVSPDGIVTPTGVQSARADIARLKPVAAPTRRLLPERAASSPSYLVDAEGTVAAPGAAPARPSVARLTKPSPSEVVFGAPPAATAPKPAPAPTPEPVPDIAALAEQAGRAQATATGGAKTNSPTQAVRAARLSPVAEPAPKPAPAPVASRRATDPARPDGSGTAVAEEQSWDASGRPKTVYRDRKAPATPAPAPAPAPAPTPTPTARRTAPAVDPTMLADTEYARLTAAAKQAASRGKWSEADTFTSQAQARASQLTAERAAAGDAPEAATAAVDSNKRPVERRRVEWKSANGKRERGDVTHTFTSRSGQPAFIIVDSSGKSRFVLESQIDAPSDKPVRLPGKRQPKQPSR